jgi:hypothetical protein
MSNAIFYSVVLFVATALLACTPRTVLPTPTLLGIVESKIHVGGSITFVGSELFPTDTSRTDVELSGEFQPAGGGSPQAVRGVRLMPHRKDANTLVLTNFGPYSNPFSSTGDEVGTFIGQATAINRPDSDITNETRGAPVPVTLEVGPSVIVSSFQPKRYAGTCAGPVRRVIGAFNYVIKFKAAGFTAENFSVTISGEPGLMLPRTFRVASGPDNAGSFGEDGGPFFFFFREVPANLSFYTADLDISALSRDGKVYSTRYIVAVHKPIEYITTGPGKIAEYYQPEQVSECYPGSANGVTYTWMSTNEETVQRHADTTWDRATMHETGVDGSHTNSNTVQVNLTTSTQNGWSAGWQQDQSNVIQNASSSGWNNATNAEYNGSRTSHQEFTNTTTNNNSGDLGNGDWNLVVYDGKVDNTNVTTSTSVVTSNNSIADANGYNDSAYGSNETMNSVTNSFGNSFQQNHEDTYSTVVGHDYTQSDTEGYSYQTSLNQTYGGDTGWMASSSTSESKTIEVNVLPLKQAAVFRQRIRWFYPGLVVLYDYCGNHQVLAQAGFTDYTWQPQVEQGDTCPPTPTILPPAQCLIGCAGHN